MAKKEFTKEAIERRVKDLVVHSRMVKLTTYRWGGDNGFALWLPMSAQERSFPKFSLTVVPFFMYQNIEKTKRLRLEFRSDIKSEDHRLISLDEILLTKVPAASFSRSDNAMFSLNLKGIKFRYYHYADDINQHITLL